MSHVGAAPDGKTGHAAGTRPNAARTTLPIVPVMSRWKVCTSSWVMTISSQSSKYEMLPPSTGGRVKIVTRLKGIGVAKPLAKSAWSVRRSWTGVSGVPTKRSASCSQARSAIAPARCARSSRGAG